MKKKITLIKTRKNKSPKIKRLTQSSESSVSPVVFDLVGHEMVDPALSVTPDQMELALKVPVRGVDGSGLQDLPEHDLSHTVLLPADGTGQMGRSTVIRVQSRRGPSEKRGKKCNFPT